MKKDISKLTLKFVEGHLHNFLHYTQELEKETQHYKTVEETIYHKKRIDELTRIVTAIEEVYNELDEEKKQLIQLYFFHEERKTLEAVSQSLYINVRTANRWKKTITESIAYKLGWI